MSRIISFKNDLFFKYAFGQNDKESMILREYICHYLFKKQFHNIITSNPEIIPEVVKDKKVILDVLCELNDVIVDMEMQDSYLNQYQYHRFQFYHSRLITKQIQSGDEYTQIKNIFQIIFINDLNASPQDLITRYTLNQKGNNLNFHLVHMIFVNIPCIDYIVKTKKVLNAFEAMIYLFHKSTLQGIQYKDKKGVIKIMEQKYEQFTRNNQLVDSAWQREIQTINLDLMMQSSIEEATKRAMNEGKKEGHRRGVKQGIEQGIQQGIKQGIKRGIKQGVKRGVKQGIKQGIQKGYKQGAEEAEMRCIRIMMENEKMNCDEAMSALHIDKEKRNKYRNIIMG